LVSDDLLIWKTKSLVCTQARRARDNIALMDFGGLAIMVTRVTVDPMALRRRLSPVLPLSVRWFT